MKHSDWTATWHPFTDSGTMHRGRHTGALWVRVCKLCGQYETDLVHNREYMHALRLRRAAEDGLYSDCRCATCGRCQHDHNGLIHKWKPDIS